MSEPTQQPTNIDVETLRLVLGQQALEIIMLQSRVRELEQQARVADSAGQRNSGTTVEPFKRGT